MPGDLPTVHRSMRVMEIVTLCPEAADIMSEYGLHCFSCSIGGAETLEEGCAMHGWNDELIDELIDDLNRSLAETPPRPPSLTITPDAARKIGAIALEEGRVGQVLEVIVDEHGGFCMEFRPEPHPALLSFSCPEVPDIKISVSLLTLSRIGGATIDFRDERFKLDLARTECGCGEERCGC